MIPVGSSNLKYYEVEYWSSFTILYVLEPNADDLELMVTVLYIGHLDNLCVLCKLGFPHIDLQAVKFSI